jgi:hypothetical protein
MTAKRTRRVLVSLLVIAVLVGLSMAGGAVTVAVKTNGGHVLQGALSGLGPTLRLQDPTPPVGPAAQFDIPLASIEQMWVNFPRVVIETTDHVIVGPYSAFAGIAQLLKIESAGSVTEVPFAAVQAIAFNGASFHTLPREWLGRDWLNQRSYVVNKTAGVIGEAAVATVAAEVETETQVVTTSLVNESDEVIWNGAAAVEPAPAASTGQLPWWLALVAVAVVVAVFFLVPTGSGA